MKERVYGSEWSIHGLFDRCILKFHVHWWIVDRCKSTFQHASWQIDAQRNHQSESKNQSDPDRSPDILSHRRILIYRLTRNSSESTRNGGLLSPKYPIWIPLPRPIGLPIRGWNDPSMIHPIYTPVSSVFDPRKGEWWERPVSPAPFQPTPGPKYYVRNKQTIIIKKEKKRITDPIWRGSRNPKERVPALGSIPNRLPHGHVRLGRLD